MRPDALERLTWRQTRARMRADRARLLAVLAEARPDAPRRVGLHPSFVCVALYRVSNHLYRAGHRWLARVVWHLNLLITGADISEPADLGEGLVVTNPAGVAIMGTAGRNLTVMACAGIGGELGRREDVGAGPGLPVLGDDVVLEPHAGVLGPVRLGDRVRVMGHTVTTEDAGDDAVIESAAIRMMRRRELV